MDERHYLINRQETLYARLKGLEREKSNAWVWFWILFLFVAGILIALIVLLVKIFPVNEEIRRTQALIAENRYRLSRVGLDPNVVQEYNDVKTLRPPREYQPKEYKQEPRQTRARRIGGRNE